MKLQVVCFDSRPSLKPIPSGHTEVGPETRFGRALWGYREDHFEHVTLEQRLNHLLAVPGVTGVVAVMAVGREMLMTADTMRGPYTRYEIVLATSDDCDLSQEKNDGAGLSPSGLIARPSP